MPRLTCLLVLLALWLAGCGVSAQDRALPVARPTAGGGVQTAAPEGDGPPVTVYFIRNARLEPVQRGADDRSSQTALQLLAWGPTSGEVASGVRTALARQPLTAQVSEDGSPGTVVVGTTRDFLGVPGGDQLLAVAQLVWTATEASGIDRVRVTVEGEVVEVPTDRGLTRDTVTRADYLSVAPGPAARR